MAACDDPEQECELSEEELVEIQKLEEAIESGEFTLEEALEDLGIEYDEEEKEEDEEDCDETDSCEEEDEKDEEDEEVQYEIKVEEE